MRPNAGAPGRCPHLGARFDGLAERTGHRIGPIRYVIALHSGLVGPSDARGLATAASVTGSECRRHVTSFEEAGRGPWQTGTASDRTVRGRLGAAAHAPGSASACARGVR